MKGFIIIRDGTVVIEEYDTKAGATEAARAAVMRTDARWSVFKKVATVTVVKTTEVDENV